MHQRISVTLFFILLAIIVYAQPSDDYYQKIDGLKKTELKLALKNIIINHTQLSYSGDLPKAYRSVYYVDGNNTDLVYDLFSEEQLGFDTGGWNKEHVVPKSWWGSTVNKSYSDIFSVIPSEISANTAKSNYPIGIVNRASFDNGRIKVGTAVNGQGGSYHTVFEPADEFKGDFARIYFYVATCYSDNAWGSKSTVQSELVKEDWPTLKPWLYQLLIKWNNEDPVCEKEQQINDDAERIQGNRNPFIDYPKLADYIWGDSLDVAFDLASAKLYQHVFIDSNENDDPSLPDIPDDPNTSIDSTAVIIEGETLLADSFDEVENGDNISTTGSSKEWDGDKWFTNVSAAYQAGGAIRMGTSKKAGSISTGSLNYAGGAMIVELKVKGWSSVEGTLVVMLGGESQTVTYKATLNQPYETVRLVFFNVKANPSLSISTSDKRCFIDDVMVKTATVSMPAKVTDVNQDGITDTQDILFVYDVIKENKELDIADVNKDNVIDTQDVLIIYETMQGK